MLLLVAEAMAAPAVQVGAVPGANLQRPAWSPDGRQLSFEANFHDEKRIELYVGEPRDGGFARVESKARPVSSLTAGFRTSDGGKVVHELGWGPASLGAYVYAASNDLFDYELFVSGGGAIAPGPGADGLPRWSPDGRRIVFTSARTGEGDLYLVDVDAIEQPPVRLTTQAGSSELYADWSPDGRSLVYVAHTEAGDNLWLLPSIAPGVAPARLTSWVGNQIRPRFSADGRIAFYANHEDPERFDLYVVKPGETPRLLVADVYPDSRGPSWTPDGSGLVYVADDDAELDPVRIVRLDGGAPATLPLGTVGHGDLDLVARDGKVWIAVVAQGRRDDPVRDFMRLFVAEVAL
jgi:Tol biopolymer transport system component